MKRFTFTAKPKKPKLCKVCKQAPVMRIGAVVCSGECAAELIMKERAKKERIEAKRKRAEAIKQKSESVPLKERLKLAEKAVNRYVRARDLLDGCISCDKGPYWDGIWHASHYKSVGSNSLLRYHLWNINKACSQCNWFKAGNISEYEKRLKLKIGADKVDWLKCQNGVKRYDAEYLDRLTRIMNKKALRQEKRNR
jgi:hypothetical protein